MENFIGTSPAWSATAATAATPQYSQSSQKPPVMGVIDESAARAAKHAISFDEYTPGSATREYAAQVESIRALCERKKSGLDERYHAEIDRLGDRYAVLLAQATNDFNRRSAQIPSVMITGPANYPTAKMRKKTDRMMKTYAEQREKLDKIEYRIRTFKPVISSADSDAIEQLEAKLAKLTAAQEAMKKANAEARKAGKPRAFQPYQLTNNNANIRSTRKRIEEIRRIQDEGEKTWGGVFPDGDEFELTQADGYFAFVFDGKPSEETRNLLKSRAFHWSPRRGRWQRKISPNANFAVNAILKECSDVIEVSEG